MSIQLTQLHVDADTKRLYGLGAMEDGTIVPLPVLTIPLIVDTHRDEVYIRMTKEALYDIVALINRSLK